MDSALVFFLVRVGSFWLISSVQFLHSGGINGRCAELLVGKHDKCIDGEPKERNGVMRNNCNEESLAFPVQ